MISKTLSVYVIIAVLFSGSFSMRGEDPVQKYEMFGSIACMEQRFSRTIGYFHYSTLDISSSVNKKRTMKRAQFLGFNDGASLVAAGENYDLKSPPVSKKRFLSINSDKRSDELELPKLNCGADAFVFHSGKTSDWIGLADGYNTELSPNYAWSIMNGIRLVVDDTDMSGPVGNDILPLDALERSSKITNSGKNLLTDGGATASIISLKKNMSIKEDSILSVSQSYVLGGSDMIVIRDGKIAFKTSNSRTALQSANHLNFGGKPEEFNSGTLNSFIYREGDVIILASDGIHNNIRPNVIEEIVGKSMNRETPPKQGTIEFREEQMNRETPPKQGTIEFREEQMNDIATNLLREARNNIFHKKCDVPANEIRKASIKNRLEYKIAELRSRVDTVNNLNKIAKIEMELKNVTRSQFCAEEDDITVMAFTVRVVSGSAGASSSGP